MHWVVAGDLRFRVADGYFLGPTSTEDATARFGGPNRVTADLLREVAATGTVPSMTEEMRRAAFDDLRFWQADALVLGPRGNREALRKTVDTLVGRAGVDIGGVWVWDVRNLVRAKSTASP